ncbi:MAG TPA: serine/threonine protein kinase [Ureibacillus sp.]|nr:serine/threonine protein kinase [Ureibacillus sp.]
MGNDWEVAIDSISKVSIYSNPNNDPVTICGCTNNLKCIGIGTDAAVFQSLDAPNYAIKKYAIETINKVKIEKEVYTIIGNSPYFSTCYAAYEDFLVLKFEEGITLYDCLLQGIHIPQQVIDDVENAREYIRCKGLNPRDLHLKNILLQNGRAKILDVSEYLQPGNDFRWEHLKEGYKKYYSLIDGHPVPLWLVEKVRKLYHQKYK